MTWNLNAQQKNTQLHKKTYINTAGVSVYVCGQDNQPSRTDKVS